MTLPHEEKRNRVILALYELHTNKGEHVDIDELQELADVGKDFYPILRQLGMNGKGWLEHRNLVVRIKSSGIDQAEELLKIQMADKERIVVEKIYELGGLTHTDMVPLDALQKALGMSFRGVNPILLDMERNKGWLEGINEAVWLTPAGIREVENPGGDRAVGIKYETHFHAPFQGGFMQGPYGTQNINIQNVKNEFDDSIDKLLKAIEASTQLSAVQKMTLANDVKTIHQLGQMEKTSEVIDAASSKVESIIGVISTTADLTSLGMVVIPIIRAFFGI